MKDIGEMTKAEMLESCDWVSWDKPIRCKSFVVIPSPAKDLHDSGYRLMTYLLLDSGGKPIAKKGGGSDVFNLDGIGGYGKDWLTKYKGLPTLVPPSSWSVDCLKRSGLLRFFGPYEIEVGASVSSVDIFSIDEPLEE